jgi:Ca-activated chloride channel family protein
VIGAHRLLSVVLAAGLSSAGSVTFVSPRRFETPVGPSTVTLDVTPPAGATVVNVRLIADGAPVGTATAPPWTFAWQAGDGSAEHKLDAIAKFSDGTEARASVTSGRQIVLNQEIVTPVKIYAIARGAKDEIVGDLRPGDVHVFENGRPQALERCAAETGPMRIALVLDASASMKGERLKATTAAAIDFLGVLRRGDEALVVSFADGASVLKEPTSDRKQLEVAIRSVSPGSGSSLYDAIDLASSRLADFRGRRVLVIVADGRDEAAGGRKVSSARSFEDARTRAVRSDAMVFVVGVGNYLVHDAKALAASPAGRPIELEVDKRRPVVTLLTSLAAATGGTILFAQAPEQVPPSFQRIADDLRHQYVLAYLPDNAKHDDTWREIKVVVDRPGVSLTTRNGYYAAK